MEPLNLLHMDLMGPMDVRGMHKGGYVLNVTDDKTNHVWTRAIYAKKDTAHHVEEIITEVKTQMPPIRQRRRILLTNLPRLAQAKRHPARPGLCLHSTDERESRENEQDAGGDGAVHAH